MSAAFDQGPSKRSAEKKSRRILFLVRAFNAYR
jgi:hypothetical protein